METTIDLRTENQKRAAERADRVAEMFCDLRAQAAGSTTAIINYIVATLSQTGTHITEMGVRYILKKRELL